MQQTKELSRVRETGKDMIFLLKLSASPVGVKLVFKGDGWDDPSAERLPHHRYCQAVMQARHGRTVWLPANGEHLAYLSEKAIPGSRSKKAFHPLMRDEAGRGRQHLRITKGELM